MNAKIQPSILNLSLFATLLAFSVPARGADTPTLKDAYKDDFYVGVAINRTMAMGTAVQVDNVNRKPEQVEKDIALVKEQFNQISPENDLKWALIQPREGPDGYNFGPADAYVNFGLSNGMFIVGHTLVWHGQTPNWVFAGTNPPPEMVNPPGTNAPGRGYGRGFGFNGPRASREELLQRMHDHIATVVGRYKGKIKVWDVVNEAVADNGTNILRNSPWLQIIGPDFIAKAFEYAHEADPDAILRYNDYSLESPAKRHKLIALIKSLQAQNVPVGAIGSQTHVSVSGPTFAAEDQALTELETLGLPIHITEFDVNSAQGGQRNTGADVAANASTTQGGLVDDANRRLADQYASLFKVFLKHKNSVKVVTLWGANDAISWRAAGKPLLFDGNDQPKPAFDAVIKVAEEDKANAH
jgi:endo-1,4-beta-xylanase